MNNTNSIENNFQAERALFETAYTSLRGKEGRLYNNEELAHLPDINHTHPLYREWRIRKQSFERLNLYLNKKFDNPAILEVGCGNGWLAAGLAKLTKGAVTGIDINSLELEQARDVFQLIPGLQFIYGDLRNGLLPGKKFNVIIFAASIQYFSSLQEIIDCAFTHLKPGGEIHILDSHFYKSHEIEEAKQRSLNHFRSAGYPAMANLYYHHCIDTLEKYNYQLLYNPLSFVHKLLRKKNPFYHICISKK